MDGISDLFNSRPAVWRWDSSPIVFELKGFDHQIIGHLTDSAIHPKAKAQKFKVRYDMAEISIDFKSHMRDFEVVPSDNLIIARGQGIGVIADFTRNFYIKIWKDKHFPGGYTMYVTRWTGLIEDQVQAEHILKMDFRLGYHIFVIDYKGNHHNLCDRTDEQDQKATPILFSTFQKYAQYDSDE